MAPRRSRPTVLPLRQPNQPTPPCSRLGKRPWRPAMDWPILLIAAVAAAIALAACADGDSEKKSRGMHYMPEMYDTLALKSQTAFESTDGATRHQTSGMLVPPAGTVSRGF